jgi:hypothetical protein
VDSVGFTQNSTHLIQTYTSISEVAEFDPANDTSPILSHPPTIEFQIPKPVRPHEFRSHVALPFVGLHIALAITLGVLWMKSQPQGKSFFRQFREYD